MEVHLHHTQIGHRNPIYALAIDKERGQLYSGGSDTGIVQWGLEAVDFQRVFSAVPSPVLRILPVHEYDVLLVGLQNGQALMLNAVTGELIQTLGAEPSSGIFGLAYHSDRLYMASTSGKVQVYALDSRSERVQVLAVSEHLWNAAGVRSLSLDRDGTVLALGYKDGTVSVHQTSDMNCIWTKKAHEHTVSALSFSPDGQVLLSGGRDAHIRVHDSFTGTELRDWIPHWFAIYAIAYQPGGKLFATASRDKSIKLWSAEDFRLLKVLHKDRGLDAHSHSVNTLIWSPSGHRLYTAGDDRRIKVWNLSQ